MCNNDNDDEWIYVCVDLGTASACSTLIFHDINIFDQVDMRLIEIVDITNLLIEW